MTTKQLSMELGKSRATINRYKKQLLSDEHIVHTEGTKEERFSSEGVEIIREHVKKQQESHQCKHEGCGRFTKNEYCTHHTGVKKDSTFKPEMVTVCGMKMRKSIMNYNDDNSLVGNGGIPEYNTIPRRSCINGRSY